MRKTHCLIIMLCITIFVASAATAQQDYHQIDQQGGVQVMARYNPFGDNNLIVAFVRFVNTNQYKVNVVWTPFISCQDLPVKRGYGAPFTLGENKSHEITIWRSQACGPAKLEGIKVEMSVGKEDQ